MGAPCSKSPEGDVAGALTFLNPTKVGRRELERAAAARLRPRHRERSGAFQRFGSRCPTRWAATFPRFFLGFTLFQGVTRRKISHRPPRALCVQPLQDPLSAVSRRGATRAAGSAAGRRRLGVTGLFLTA